MIELNVKGSNAPALVDDCWAALQRYVWKLDENGYVYRMRNRRHLYLHHVVMPGDRYPEFVRDHISRDKLDNRSENLRWLTQAESAQNRGACRKNKTGVRGVRLEGNRYRARVQHNGKTIACGRFDTLAEAETFLARVRPAILMAATA